LCVKLYPTAAYDGLMFFGCLKAGIADRRDRYQLSVAGKGNKLVALGWSLCCHVLTSISKSNCGMAYCNNSPSRNLKVAAAKDGPNVEAPLSLSRAQGVRQRWRQALLTVDFPPCKLYRALCPYPS